MVGPLQIMFSEILFMHQLKTALVHQNEDPLKQEIDIFNPALASTQLAIVYPHCVYIIVHAIGEKLIDHISQLFWPLKPNICTCQNFLVSIFAII